jgi:hypothetical protein
MMEWSDALSNLTKEQIRHGIRAVRQDRDWPPSIAEFLAASRGSWEHRGAAYKTDQQRLPKPKASKATVSANLAEIKKALLQNNRNSQEIDP